MLVARRSPLAHALLAGCLVLATPAAAQSWCAPQRADTGFVALTGLTLWDGTGAPSRARTTVLLHGERIETVFPDASRPLPPGTTVRRLDGKFAIPGLMDTHVHVATDVSGEDRRPRTELRLCRALLGGVTAVRDMAGDTRALGSLARDAKVGDIASPDLYYAALWAGPAFFRDPRTALASAGEVPGSMPGMRAVDSSTNLPLAVAEARGTGATAIKLYAALSPPLVEAVVMEAHRQGMLVWAHAAMSLVSPLQMTEAGVDVLSHGTLLARQVGRPAYDSMTKESIDLIRARISGPVFDTLFDAMHEHGTIFEPTLFVYGDGDGKARAIAAEATRRARAEGVTVVAGTDSLGSGDAGGWLAPNLHEELRLLVEQGGFTPSEALEASTRHAAEAVSAERDRGTLQPGRLADIVILDADPLREIRSVGSVRAVYKRGAAYPGGPTLGP